MRTVKKIATALTVYAILVWLVIYYSTMWSWITGDPNNAITGTEAAKATAIVIGVTVVTISAFGLFVALLLWVTNKWLERYQTLWEE